MVTTIRSRAISAVAAAVMMIVTAMTATARASDEVRLSGAGATFPQPLYERWVVEYQRLHPHVKIDYQGVGSGGGIKAITDKTVAFAGSDAPLTRREREALGGESAVLEFPTAAGGVVPAYSVPGVRAPINFTGELLADIFLGKVSKWNDPRVAALNPGVTLPDLSITPAWRTDGSGTTFVFSSYLATQSEAFKSTVGMGKQVKWPVGQGGKGNPGVAAIIAQTPGAIGYIEQNFAAKNSIQYGAVQNQAGVFVKASPESISEAGASAAARMSKRLTADIWNQPGEKVYPISAFTYLIVYRDLNNLQDEDQATALIEFLTWALSDGQSMAAALEYAPLSEEVRAKAAAAVAEVTFNGKSPGSK